MENKITIEYCQPCGFEKSAQLLSVELRLQFGSRIAPLDLKPTRSIGAFEVYLDEDLVYSKKNTGRLPHPGEVEGILMTRLLK